MVYVIPVLVFMPVSDGSLPVNICVFELQLSIPRSLSKLILRMRGGVSIDDVCNFHLAPCATQRGNFSLL